MNRNINFKNNTPKPQNPILMNIVIFWINLLNNIFFYINLKKKDMTDKDDNFKKEKISKEDKYK
jgi:hypothetical protein